MLKKYESLIGYIDLINHSALTQDQHDLLDKIIEHEGITLKAISRIYKIYSNEELLKPKDY